MRSCRAEELGNGKGRGTAERVEVTRGEASSTGCGRGGFYRLTSRDAWVGWGALLGWLRLVVGFSL